MKNNKVMDLTITKVCSICAVEKFKYLDYQMCIDKTGDHKLKNTFCKKCCTLKELERRNKDHKSYLEYSAKYRAENKDKIKTFYEENKMLILENCKEYRETHKEQIKEYKNIYYQQEEDKIRVNEKLRLRKEIDPQFKLITKIRSCISTYLRGRKSNSTKELMDCDEKFLKEWIEYQFDNNMSWDNYGTYWHIDHVIPLAFFNLDNTEEHFIACHWSNLRPLEAHENLSKNSRIRKHDVLPHLEIIEKFNKKMNVNCWYSILKSNDDNLKLLNNENHHFKLNLKSIILRHYQIAGTS